MGAKLSQSGPAGLPDPKEGRKTPTARVHACLREPLLMCARTFVFESWCAHVCVCVCVWVHVCMLIIRSVHFLPDGRSVVDTIGGKRFRVLSRGMRDGYSIADIEHLEDTRVEDGEELVRLQRLHDGVYDQAVRWFQNLKVRFHNQILQHFGPMPAREADIQATPNGPACCWWLLAVLPIDPRHQLSVLAMTSLRERLQKIQHILTYLQSVPDS